MNYRHRYHAGNVGDVLKHVVLIALAQALQLKDSAFGYLDTHAGIGLYDLSVDNKEYLLGIKKLIDVKNPPLLIAEYLKLVRRVNTDSLKFYPGSPAIMRELLRPQDKMILCELQDEDYLLLRKQFAGDKQVAVHHQDGYVGLKAFLPLPQKRGIVLIDPAYEQANESEIVMRAVKEAVRRFETGVFAIWYPVKTQQVADHFCKMLDKQIGKPSLRVELNVLPTDNSISLNGSGVYIVNPPWQLDSRLREPLHFLWEKLGLGCLVPPLIS